MSIEKPFSPSEALQELRRGLHNRRVRRLSFPEMCGIFSTLRTSVEKPTISHATICRAFNVTPTTVSLLAHCLTSNRYGAVKREFERLGEIAFSERYYTEEIHTRLMEAKHAVTAERAYAPNPGATKYSFKGGGQNPPFGAVECFENFYRIDWLGEKHFPDRPERRGWWYSPCNQDGSRFGEHWQWRGDRDRPDQGPFLTSTRAYRQLWRIQTGEDPLRGGR
jgi:hypothetical protein